MERLIEIAGMGTPEEVKSKYFNRYDAVSPQFAKILKQIDDKERRDYEAVRWGPLKQRRARQQAKVDAARRKSRGVKYINPFLGQAIKKK